ncbi:metallophosphoesterase [Chloroflexota bacterium]
MSNKIKILHLSDLHANIKERDEIRRRTKTLLNDVESQYKEIDVVVCTGDIAFSGQLEEYELAKELLFEQIINRFRVPKSNILIVPGNHDVNRAAINPHYEEGIRLDINNTRKASDYLANDPNCLDRMQCYYNFIKEYFNLDRQVFYSNTLTIRGINIGFACLNSSWRCSSDHDEGTLFLSDWQVNTALDKLEGCVMKVALLHHPFSYYHGTESDYTIKDIKRSFEIALSGHIHSPESLAEISPDHDCIILASPAIHSTFNNIGYNIYEIDFDNRIVLAKYRKYTRGRDKFIPDFTNADDGEMTFDLPTRNLALLYDAVVCQRITTVTSELEESIKRQLRRFQEIENPILVSPYIKRITWNNGRLIETVYKGHISDIAQNNCIISGPEQSGKSIFLQSLASTYNSNALEKQMKSFALHIDLGKQLYGKEGLKVLISQKLKDNNLENDYNAIVLCFDHLVERDQTQYEIINSVIQDIPNSKAIMSVTNTILLDSLGTNNLFKNYEYYEIAYWGPSRIHEFTKQFCVDRNIEASTAYSFIVNSLRDSDLQASPVIITLYLFAFLIQGSELTSLTFLQVLEKIEEYRLRTNDVRPQSSFYFKRQILMRLAVECKSKDCLALERTGVEKFISDYFDTKGLDVNVGIYLSDLHDSGFLYVSDDTVEFKQYVFYDYYLALAMKEGIQDPAEIIYKIASYIDSSDAVALYCGLNREYIQAPSTLFDHMKLHFKEAKDISLKDLDDFISDLLIPLDKSISSDSIVATALKEKIDYENLDKNFEHQKNSYQNSRKYTRYLENPTSNIEELYDKVLVLKSFYNTFRNLEALDLQHKEDFLDRILNYHIDCNMDLVKYFCDLTKDSNIQTVIGYIMTLGGQRLLSTNIANQSLYKPILHCMENTNNDFKKLLLVCLFADLHLPGYTEFLREFAEQTTSKAGAEIVYLKIHELLIRHESESIPAKLIAAFETAFRKRYELNKSKINKGALQNILHTTLKDAQIKHKLLNLSDKRLKSQ